VTTGTESVPGAISAEQMAIVLDRDSDVALGTQLAWALRSAIGSAPAGTQLPALRELAAATGVNVNTARVVYQRLAGEGLVQSRQGAGTFVGESSRSFDAASRIAADAVREARESGVDPRLVAAQLYVAREEDTGAPGAAAQRRRALRTQIAALERALGDLHAAHPDRVSPPEPAAGASARLLSEKELEEVRAGLVRSLGATQNAIDAAKRPPRPPSADAAPAKPARGKARSRRSGRVSPATG
jgi:DNA-binding transcriptional regulator YhcF (GntR family)